MMNLTFPSGINASIFLENYWQKKPLLIRGGMRDLSVTLSADELAGLSCEDEVESRIVIEEDSAGWKLLHGPFSPRTFADLPDKKWTLLVQDVDKHLPGMINLMQNFNFIPDWRIDDIMISYAADQGSVGPHVDAYDVFLIQIEGRRSWRISHNQQSNEHCLPDLPLKILAGFNPDEEWVLEPGDVLYLPPGIPHWGIADGECMTCSVGFRAPSYQEMLADWCQTLIENTSDSLYYTDPDLSIQAHSAEIIPGTFEKIDSIMEQLLESSSTARKRWFGCHVTEPKAHWFIEQPEEEIRPEDVAVRLSEYSLIRRHPFTRIAFATIEAELVTLFVAGNAYAIASNYAGFVYLLADNHALPSEQMAKWLEFDDCTDLLAELINQGFLLFDNE